MRLMHHGAGCWSFHFCSRSFHLCNRAIASMAAMSPMLTSEKLLLSHQSCIANISVKQEENRPLAIIG